MKLKKLLVTGMALLASVTAFTSVAQAATSSQVQKVIDESYEIREQEHTNEFPLYMHIDRLAKSNEYRCI